MDRAEIVLRFIDKGIGVKGATFKPSQTGGEGRSIRRSIWFLSGNALRRTIYARIHENWLLITGHESPRYASDLKFIWT